MDFFFLCRPAAYPKWGVVTAVSYFHGFLTQAAGWDSASDETHEQKLIAACYRQNTRGAMIQPLTVFQWVSVVLLSCHPVSCFILKPMISCSRNIAAPRQAAMKRNSSRLNRGTGHTGWMPSSGSSTAIMSVSLWMGSRSRRQIRRSGSGPAASPSSLPTVLSRWTKRASESAPKGRLPSSVSCSTSPGRLGRLVHVICPGHTPRPIVLSAMPCCPGHTCIRAACPRQAASRTKCRCSLHMRPGSSTLE